MSYDDERPVDWTSYDCVASASNNLRFMLSMGGIPEQLKLVLGPENYKRAIELLDCIDKRLKAMGAIGLSWASLVMDHTAVDVAIAERVAVLREGGDINSAWNIAEKWAKGAEIPELDEEEE